MFATAVPRRVLLSLLLILGASAFVSAQTPVRDDSFGPVVSTYLGYLRNEQEVVDDRASRHEVTPAYYRRNSNRIRALRQMAIRIAVESQNDYIPELEAVAADELRQLFERPPRLQTLKVGEVYRTTFRYLGSVRSGDTFYLFQRLDPYEQAEFMQKQNSASQSASGATVANPGPNSKATTRGRRVSTP
jgi:hypothetical protein